MSYDELICDLVLASASRRRRELLERAGLRLLVRVAGVDETPRPGEAPGALAKRLARAKLEAVAAGIAAESGPAARFVLAADTVVAVDGEILGKPRDAAEARAMIRRLSGRTHDVLTGYAILRLPPDRAMREGVVRTEVTFRELSGEVVGRYVDSGEPMDKAGAYGIQGTGAMLVRSVSGSYTNVVGLPLVEVLESLEALGGPAR
jgi:septum formation protein